MKSKTPAIFLTVIVWYDLELDLNEYLVQLEDSIHELAKQFKGVESAGSSADETVTEYQEEFSLGIYRLSEIDSVSEALLGLVRRFGIPQGCRIEIAKRIVSSNELLTKKVELDCDTKWRGEEPMTLPFEGPISLPKRLKYLEKTVSKYYGAGGNDPYDLFPLDDGLSKFINELSSAEKKQIRSAYERILKNKDHLWITLWCDEDDGAEREQQQVLYFLAFLDRLNEGGLNPDRVQVKVMDWNTHG